MIDRRALLAAGLAACWLPVQAPAVQTGEIHLELAGFVTQLDDLWLLAAELPEHSRGELLRRLPEFVRVGDFHFRPTGRTGDGRPYGRFVADLHLVGAEEFCAAASGANGNEHGSPGGGRPSCGDESLSLSGSRLLDAGAPAVPATSEVAHG